MHNNMGKYLVTGRSGSGKSEVGRELKRQGILSFDGDLVAGLASWVDLATGKPANVNDYAAIDSSLIGWNWNSSVLENLLTQHDTFFLCGSADNQLGYHELFTKVFVLTLNPETQRERLQKRTEHDYGKDPHMQEEIITNQAVFVEQALGLGAIAIDSMLPVSHVVDQILSHIDDDSILA
jgi:gluconate kinase